jgi:hypothetical protein
MKKLKSIAVLLIAIVVTVCGVGINVPLEVRAYEAPTDIHVIVETKEIDIDDIPEDRCVSLNIYTENCPPYLGLELVFEKDSRLGYNQYTPFSPAVNLSGMGGLAASYHAAAPDFLACLIPASGDNLIDYNGALIQVNLILPENVSEGEFYKFEPLKKYDNGYTMSSSIFFENSFDASFKETPFSQLTCGGIKITRKAPLQTEPPVAEPENTPAPEANNNVPPQEAPTENNNSQPDTNNQNSDQETQTQAVTEEVTTAAETTETTATQTEVTTVTVTEKTTVTTEETTVSATATTVASEAFATSENVEESEEKSNNILYIIIPVAIAAVLTTVFIIKNKIKRKK